MVEVLKHVESEQPSRRGRIRLTVGRDPTTVDFVLLVANQYKANARQMVAILILNCNGADYTVECAESFRKVVYPHRK